jgi:nitrous oxidase accessory protein NosD
MLVDCLTIAAAIASAQPGATLTVRPGSDCPPLELRGRQWAKPVTIIATGARFQGVRLREIDGLIWRGGTLVAEGGKTGAAFRGYSVRIQQSRNITFEDTEMRDAVRGAVVADSANITFRGNHIHTIRSDGINMARTHGGLIERNHIHSFSPIPMICTLKSGEVQNEVSRRDCAARGGEWKDGDHPDGVQFWGAPSDIRVVDNRLEGNFQAIAHFGRGEPARRLVAERNFIRVERSHGVSFFNCQDCRIVGNDIGRLKPDGRNVVIRTPDATGTFCGNRAPDMRAGNAGTQRCPPGTPGVPG